jgi:hypothetical protein
VFGNLTVIQLNVAQLGIDEILEVEAVDSAFNITSLVHSIVILFGIDVGNGYVLALIIFTVSHA